jgi:Fe-S-cluster formation regulator IscX/YfhJ
MGKIKNVIIQQMNDDEEKLNEQIINTVMREAREYGLETEVQATAMALMEENPDLDSGSAYHYAALEWDI